MLNKVQLIGFTGGEAEIRTTTGGKKVATLRVATNRYTKKGGERKDYTTWHQVEIWNQATVNWLATRGLPKAPRSSSKAKSATTATPTPPGRNASSPRWSSPRPSTSSSRSTVRSRTRPTKRTSRRRARPGNRAGFLVGLESGNPCECL